MTPAGGGAEFRPAALGRRVGAFLIDSLLLIIAGRLLGLFFADFFMLSPGWARLIGLLVAGAYLVPLHGWPGGGQTAGKYLLSIRVVGRDGRPVSMPRSLLRYLAFAPPLFLNNFAFPGQETGSPLWLLVLLGFFGLGISSAYLLLFNWRTRQLPHDLIAGTLVVAEQATEPVAARIWRGHLVVCGVLVLLWILPPVLMSWNGSERSLSRLLALQRAIKAGPGVLYAGVSLHEGTGDVAGLRVINVIVTVPPGRERDQASLLWVAETVLQRYPMLGIYGIQITLRSGFDIGIAADWESQTYAQTPVKWRHDVDVARAVAAMAPPEPIARLRGQWSWTNPRECVETFTFHEDGAWSAVIGSEYTQGSYRLYSAGSLGGYMPLQLTTLGDDGGEDCTLSSAIDTGEISTVYAAFHPAGDAMALCSETKAESCWGVYRRVKAP